MSLGLKVTDEIIGLPVKFFCVLMQETKVINQSSEKEQKEFSLNLSFIFRILQQQLSFRESHPCPAILSQYIQESHHSHFQFPR